MAHALHRLGSAAVLGVISLGAGPAPASAADSPSPSVLRVGGALDATVSRAGDSFRSGASFIEAPLAEGYPEPTPPGAIDIKTYPSVRLAKVSGDGTPDRRGGGGFFPLFNHIKRNDIAMTSPVVMDYDGMDDPSASPEGWSMAFLYQNPDLGPTGTDPKDGRVEVIDSEPLTVVSIGIRGPYGMQTTRRGLDRLFEWIDGQDEWVIDGNARTLSYNGPYVPDRVKWSEVQVPVRRATAERPDTSASPDFMPLTIQ